MDIVPEIEEEDFSKVKDVWSYFYRDAVNDELIEDGVIEQWHFSTTEAAEKACQIMNKLGYRLLYFNTNPQFIRKDNFVFVLYTRAMAFSGIQKDLKVKLGVRLEDE